MMPSTYEEENAERGKKANKCILKFNARWAKKQKRGRNIYTEVKKKNSGSPDVQRKGNVQKKSRRQRRGRYGTVRRFVLYTICKVMVGQCQNIHVVCPLMQEPVIDNARSTERWLDAGDAMRGMMDVRLSFQGRTDSRHDHESAGR